MGSNIAYADGTVTLFRWKFFRGNDGKVLARHPFGLTEGVDEDVADEIFATLIEESIATVIQNHDVTEIGHILVSKWCAGSLVMEGAITAEHAAAALDDGDEIVIVDVPFKVDGTMHNFTLRVRHEDIPKNHTVVLKT